MGLTNIHKIPFLNNMLKSAVAHNIQDTTFDGQISNVIID